MKLSSSPGPHLTSDPSRKWKGKFRLWQGGRIQTKEIKDGSPCGISTDRGKMKTTVRSRKRHVVGYSYMQLTNSKTGRASIGRASATCDTLIESSSGNWVLVAAQWESGGEIELWGGGEIRRKLPGEQFSPPPRQQKTSPPSCRTLSPWGSTNSTKGGHLASNRWVHFWKRAPYGHPAWCRDIPGKGLARAGHWNYKSTGAKNKSVQRQLHNSPPLLPLSVTEVDYRWAENRAAILVGREKVKMKRKSLNMKSCKIWNVCGEKIHRIENVFTCSLFTDEQEIWAWVQAGKPSGPSIAQTELMASSAR